MRIQRVIFDMGNRNRGLRYDLTCNIPFPYRHNCNYTKSEFGIQWQEEVVLWWFPLLYSHTFFQSTQSVFSRVSSCCYPSQNSVHLLSLQFRFNVYQRSDQNCVAARSHCVDHQWSNPKNCLVHELAFDYFFLPF